jgi:GNAT superfamily N-acetyltransferase
VTVRAARPGDEADIHRMITELAEYERSASSVESSPADLAAALFVESPAVFCHVAEGAAGLDAFALWYVTYSTWTGRHGIWLEDLYVRPESRGRGAGRALLAELAAECERRGYRRLEWWVLDWNTPALAFYESIGATPMSEWTVQRVDGPALQVLASGTTAAPGAERAMP